MLFIDGVQMKHSERKHAKFGASGAYRWMVCPGSVRLCENVTEDQKSLYSLAGTAAHEVLNHALVHKIWDAEQAWIDMECPHTHTAEFLLREYFDAVQVALDFVRDLMDMYPDAVIWVERPFAFPSLVDPDNAWGTNDICVWVPSLKLLYVIDYKHGYGIAVEVEDNKQLLYYTAGVCATENIEPATTVICVIQPNKPHVNGAVRPWVVPDGRLEQFIQDVDEAILRAHEPNAPLVPHRQAKGHCQFCPAKISCPALERQAAQAVQPTFRTFREVKMHGVPPNIEEVVKTWTPAHLSMALDGIATYDALKAAVKKQALDVLLRGGVVPGYKIVEARPRRKWWGDQTAIAQALMRMLNTDDWDLVYPRELIDITKVEKKVVKVFRDLAPRGQKKNAAMEAKKALATLTLKESTGAPKLADAGDSRPAINPAATNFRQVVALAQPSPDEVSEDDDTDDSDA